MRWNWKVAKLVAGTLCLASPAFAQMAWQNRALSCAIDETLGSGEIEHWRETNPDIEPAPDACVVGHWQLIPGSYIENLTRMTAGRDIEYDHADLIAEFFANDNGIVRGCLEGDVTGSVAVQDQRATFHMTMSGPGVSIVRKDAETAELVSGSDAAEAFEAIEFYKMKPIMDGVTAVGAVNFNGMEIPIDVVPVPMFSSVSANVRCGANRMTITAFPEGVDYVEHTFRRLR